MSDAPEGLVTLEYIQSALGWPYSSVWSEARRGSFGTLKRRGRAILVERDRVDVFVRQRAILREIEAGTNIELAERLRPLVRALQGLESQD